MALACACIYPGHWAACAVPACLCLCASDYPTTTITNLVITDTIPLHAHYITGGTRLGDQVAWAVTTLAPSATITNTFVVTATQSLINRDYRAHADGGLATVGAVAVVTLIGEAKVPQPPPMEIIHMGGYLTCRYQDKTAGLPLNRAYNPSLDLYLPLIQQQ